MKKFFYSKTSDCMVIYDTSDDTIDMLDLIHSEDEVPELKEAELPINPVPKFKKGKTGRKSAISDADKNTIERMMKAGTPVSEIAKEFGVKPQTIYNMRSRSKIHVSAKGTKLVDLSASLSGKPVFDEHTFGLIKDCKADNMTASEIAERYEIARDDVVLAMACESYADYKRKFTS